MLETEVALKRRSICLESRGRSKYASRTPNISWFCLLNTSSRPYTSPLSSWQPEAWLGKEERGRHREEDQNQTTHCHPSNWCLLMTHTRYCHIFSNNSIKPVQIGVLDLWQPVRLTLFLAVPSSSIVVKYAEGRWVHSPSLSPVQRSTMPLQISAQLSSTSPQGTTFSNPVNGCAHHPSITSFTVLDMLFHLYL